VAVWDVQRRCLVMLLQQHPVCVEQLAFSPDGCWLVSVGSGRVVVWDIATGRATAVGAVKQVRGAQHNGCLGPGAFAHECRHIIATVLR
jgi:WD40 repeat protein